MIKEDRIRVILPDVFLADSGNWWVIASVERTFQVSRLPWPTTIIYDASPLNLMTSNNPKMDYVTNTLYLNYVHNVSFNFADYSVSAVYPYICNCVARFVSSHK